MTPAARSRARSVLASLNIVAIALVVPGILYRYVFAMPPSQAPGARAVLVGLLVAIWLAIALGPLPTPSGKGWPFWIRAAVLVGGNLIMALLMSVLASPSPRG